MGDQTFPLATNTWSAIKVQLDRQLTDESIGETIRELLGHAFSENTLNGYRSSLIHFIRWSGHDDPFPTTPELIMVYLATFSESLAPTTLQHRIAALSFFHKFKQYPDPTDDKRIQALLMGIRKKRVKDQWHSRQAKPFTIEQLRTLLSYIGNKAHDIRDKAFILTGLIGAFRTSELCNIDMDHVIRFDNAIVVSLDATKNDPLNTMKKFKVLPKIGGLFCPVEALNQWLSVSEIREGYIFRGINRHGHILENRFSHTSANAIIKKWVENLSGTDTRDYSGTSLRSSFITIARQLKIPDEVIIKQTLHQSTKTLGIYDRPEMAISDSPATTILEALKSSETPERSPVDN